MPVLLMWLPNQWIPYCIFSCSAFQMIIYSYITLYVQETRDCKKSIWGITL